MKSSELAVLSKRLPAIAGERRSRDELEFLPAALEIIETPASPAGRAIGAVLMLFLVVAVTWASLGHVEVVATAPGKIVPSARTKIVQPLEAGVVRAIRVQDGDSVKAGQILIELDPTTSGAERSRSGGELLSARLEVALLTAAVSEASDPVASLVAPAGASAEQTELAKQRIASMVGEHRAKLAELDRQRAQGEANRAATVATVEKLNAVIPLQSQTAETRKYLYDHQYGSKLTYLEAQQQLVESQHELVVQKSRLVAAEAAVQAASEQRRQAEEEFRRTMLGDLAKARDKADALAQDLVKAEQRMQLQTLTAPVDGVVQQLAVHTVGGVVTPAQTLLVIVPLDSRLEIEASVANQDVGFVHPGQSAEIKIDTFNFTRYGLLRGTVLGLSPDVVSEQPEAAPPTGAPRAPKPPAYSARIGLDRSTMDIDGTAVELRPGMTVTAEIDTGRRRIIDYLLSPILKAGHEGLTER
ncbi:MAG: HlyD family type I secretion periplasmic adaptor subunit [Stellaceae bacterium]